MKTAISVDIDPAKSPEEIGKIVGAAGADAVELVVASPEIELGDELIDAAGIVIAALNVTSLDMSRLWSADAAQRHSATQALCHWMDHAARRQCDLVVFDIDQYHSNCAQPYDDRYTFLLASLAALRFEAERRAVRLACRINGEAFLKSPIEARRFIDEVNSPWVGVCLDLSGAKSIDWTGDWIRALGWRLFSLRMSCELHADAPALLAESLRWARYDGNVTLTGEVTEK